MKLSHLFLIIIISIAGNRINAADLIRLTAAYSDNPLSSDPSVVYYESRSTENFDGAYDALKFFNTDLSVTNLYFIGKDNSKLSINAIPFSGNVGPCILRIGLKTSREGLVKFSIRDITGSYMAQPVFLTDMVNSTTWNLSLEGDFYIQLPAGQYEERFRLNIGTVMTAVPENKLNDNSLNAYTFNGTLKVDLVLPVREKGILTIYNLSGLPVRNFTVSESGTFEFSLPGSALYIVTLRYGNQKVSRKVYYQS